MGDSECVGVVGVVFVSLHLGEDGKSSFNSLTFGNASAYLVSQAMCTVESLARARIT